MKVGRPTKYKKKYCKEILEYFDIPRTKVILEKFYYKNGDQKEKEIEIANELPTIKGFAIKIGVDEDTILNWSKQHKDFFGAYKKAKDLQQEFWVQNSIRGLYNPAFTIFMGKNVFGWKDRSDVTTDDKKLEGLVILKDKSE